MDKNESDLNNLIGKLCEKLVKEYYEQNGIKLKKISPDTNLGTRFDIEGVREFLKGTSKQSWAIILLKEIKQKSKSGGKYDLPDFVVRTPNGEIQFMEVKKLGMKFSLSSITQRDSIKLLASKGFLNYIIRLKLPMNRELTPNEISLLLKGKGTDGKEAKFIVKNVIDRHLDELILLIEFELELISEEGGEIKVYEKKETE